MTWYFWVWGGCSCLALLGLIVASAVGVAYMLDMRKGGMIQELNSQISSLERRIKLRDMKIEAYQRELEEIRKDANEFGRISP